MSEFRNSKICFLSIYTQTQFNFETNRQTDKCFIEEHKHRQTEGMDGILYRIAEAAGSLGGGGEVGGGLIPWTTKAKSCLVLHACNVVTTRKCRISKVHGH